MAAQTAAQTAADVRTHDDYTVGWVCALPKELTAATAMLDQRHESLPKPPNDLNTYTLGSIGKHNIVIACLPKGHTGNSPAATVVTWMVSTFPAIKFGLMVGIGGGIPPKVRLGDVVVSVPGGSFPGVVKWDFGEAEADGFERTGALDNPPRSLLTALTKLETEHELIGSKIPEYLDELKQKWPRLAPKYLRSNSLKDVLFRSNYHHVRANTPDHGFSSNEDDENEEEENCRFCDRDKIIPRQPRDMRVHYGLIASGNQVIESATVRKRLKEEFNGHLLCVDMEAAGLMNNFPCVIIRGICDYADSHKNKDWQEHAAAVAAAFAKELLEYVQPSDVYKERAAKDILNQVLIDVSATRADVSQMKFKLENTEDLQILEWITPVDYGPQHSDFLRRRQPGTGQWLLDSPEYQKWLINEKQTLFCPGIPGAGKTILTSIVVDDLEGRFQADPTIGIAYIYCNYQRQKEQEIESLLSSLLKQLSRGLTPLPDCMREIYERHKDKQTRPLLNELLEALYPVVELYSKVFIIVDALDECQNSQGCRQRFLRELFNLQERCGLNLFATSRFIPEITSHFETTSIILQIRASTGDIERYLKSRIKQLPAFINDRQDLQEEIAIRISEAVDGMFLLAQIYLYSLNDKMTPKEIKTALKDFKKIMPGSSEANKVEVLAYTYEQAMLRINGQQPGFKNLANNVLSWIVCAERQMTKTELQHALAVEVDEPELDEDNLPSIQDMVSVCAGLVTVDNKSDVIRLVHYTTQEYFNQKRNHWFPDAEVKITNICITYLSFSIFESGPCRTYKELEERLQLNPLYGYAVDNWGHHARKASSLLLHHKVKEFLECEAKVHASLQAGHTEWRYPIYRPYNQSTVTSLHLAAYFGIKEVVKALLDEGVNINAKNSDKRTPLSLAAKNGHEVVVKQLLLMPNININIADKDGRTPLSMAIQNKHEVVVKQLLLMPNININIADKDGRTSLSMAIQNKHEVVVKQLLLMPNININIVDKDGRTPLFIAAEKGHEAVVKQLLLMPNININIADKDGRTPLFIAAEKGHEAVVKQLLLMPNININIADKDGRTPLFIAAEKGHEAVVKQLLLMPNIDINIASNPSEDSVFPSWHGHFARRDGKQYSVYPSHSTPLLIAVRNGHEAIVKQLLSMPNIDLNITDSAHKTPLSLAVENRHEAIIEQLLLMPNIDLNITNSAYRTLLFLAVENGHEAIIEQLLLMPNINLNIINNAYRTLLSSAVENGHEAVVKRLLSIPNIDIKMKDEVSQALLSLAVENGHEAIVEQLLSMPNIDLNIVDSAHRTPLWRALHNGHEGIVKLLLAAGIDPDSKDHRGLTPLLFAAFNGHEAIVELLLVAGADTGLKDCNGRTPLLDAASFGYEAIAKLLLAAGADPESKDDLDQTPLTAAVRSGHEGIVKLLLREQNITDPGEVTKLLKATGAKLEENIMRKQDYDGIKRLLESL